MHFNKSAWEAYNKGLVTDAKRQLMGQHLYECDQCLEVFLSLVNENDLRHAVETLSPEFNQNLIAKLPQADNKVTIVNQKPNLFYYYVAAACITVIFMSAGVFDSLMKNIPHIQETQIETETEELVRFGWTETLMNKTLSVLNTIKPKD